MKLETLSRRPRLRATFFFARRSCFTTTISARRRTLVTEPRRHLAALTTEPRSARLSSVAHSHNFSIAEPATTLFVPPSFSHFHLLPLRFPCYEVRDVRKITIHQMVVDNFNLGAKIFEFISWMERRVMGRKGLTHALRILYADSLYANGYLVHTHTLRSLWTSLPPCISPPISSNFLSSHAYEYLSSCGTRSTCNAKNIDYIFLALRFPLLKNIVAFFN